MESFATIDQTRPDQTIIISTYNRKEMLAEAVNSVLKQTQKSFEILIIDDCSTDGTEEFIAKNFTDPRVHYFKNEKNSGPEFSRSFGLRHAKGKYVTFLDDDDYYTDYEFFAKALKIFGEQDTENAPLAFICANADMLVTETGEFERWYNIGDSGRVNGADYILRDRKPLSTFPTVFKAEILRKAGLENLVIFDADTYREAALFGDAWFMSDYIGVYRINKERNSLGYTSHSAHYDRYFPLLCDLIERCKKIANELSNKVSRNKAQNWYIKCMLSIIFDYTSIRKIPGMRKKVIHHILKTSGFMPRLWLACIPYAIISQFRKINLLRKVVRFIKYRGRVSD